MIPTITIHVDNSTYLVPMLSIGTILSRKSNYKVIIVVGRQFDHSTKSNKLIVKSSLSVQYFKNINIARRFKSSKLIEIVELINHVVNFFQIQIKLKRIFRKHRVLLTIFPADNRFDYSYYSKVYKSSKIPLIIIPNWFAGKDEVLGTKHNSSVNIQNHFKLSLMKIFRKDYLYFMKDNDRAAISCKTFSESFADLILGTTPPNPWILHSGYSDFIFVDSKSMSDQALELGLDCNKLVITGSISHDIMYKEINNFNNSKLTEDCRILFAMPPDFFKSRHEFVIDYSSHTNMIESILTAIRCKTKSNVTISLHPSTSLDKYYQLNLESNFDVTFTNEPIENLLVHCSHFIASVSSTIRWAMALGIPVLNFDLYRFYYNDYEGAKNYIRVDSHKDFVNTLDAFLKLNHEVSSDERKYWGSIDGDAEVRILTSIERVCKFRNSDTI